MRHVLICLASVWLGLGCQFAWAQPTLARAVPGAVRPGHTIELTLQGEKLDDPLQIWTSFPAQVELLPGPEGASEQKSRTCRITPQENAGLGIGGLMAASPGGVSGVLLLPVDDLPSVGEMGSNHTPQEAQVIEPPVAIDGVADASQADYFRFTGQKGERLSVEVVATRLGMTFDAVVRLLRADGTELLLADDDDSTGADSRFSVILPEDGDYVVEIRDNQFRGGSPYRLRVGDFPVLTTPYPLGGRLGSTSRFEFAGPSASEVVPLVLQIPEHVASGRIDVAAKYPQGKSAAAVSIAATPLPELSEVEPNDEPASATMVSVPVAVNGHFGSPLDRDCYRFPALKDQSLSFRATARTLGSPSLVFMRLFDEGGQQLAETQVNESDEWQLVHKFGASGVYRLQLQDLLDRGGPEHAYRVEIEPHAGFSLAVKHDKDTRLQFNPPAGDGALALTIQCNRQGYNGPIELALEGAPAGLRLLNATVPEGAKEHRLIVAIPHEAAPGALHVWRLVGRARVDGQTQSAPVTTQPTLRAQRPQQLFPPAWLDGLLAMAAAPAADPAFALQFEAPAAEFQRDAGQGVLTFTLERKQAEFKEGVTVLVENLPAGFSYAVKPEGDKYTVTVSGPKDAPDGTHMLRLCAYGEFQGRGRLVVSEVPLELKSAAAAAQSQ